MKLSFLRMPSALALALCLSVALSACGGRNSVSIGGKVLGLTDTGLTIASNGTTIPIPSGAATYTFPNQVNVDSAYAVTVQTQPVHQTCYLANATGTATGTQIDYVNITCAQNAYKVSGTVKGFTGAQDTLVLANGPISVSPPPGDSNFSFPLVADGTSYNIAVAKQPPGQTCTVANGTGVMGTKEVINVAVTCV